MLSSSSKELLDELEEFFGYILMVQMFLSYHFSTAILSLEEIPNTSNGGSSSSSSSSIQELSELRLLDLIIFFFCWICLQRPPFLDKRLIHTVYIFVIGRNLDIVLCNANVNAAGHKTGEKLVRGKDLNRREKSFHIV